MYEEVENSKSCGTMAKSNSVFDEIEARLNELIDNVERNTQETNSAMDFIIGHEEGLIDEDKCLPPMSPNGAIARILKRIGMLEEAVRMQRIASRRIDSII